MDLITPAFGLIFWQTLIFLIVLFVLGKFAWKPIIHALKTREDSIDGALKSAQQAREEMEKLKVENEKLLAAAREERNNMMKDAGKVANELKDVAKKDAEKIGEKMIEDARATINSEKEEAILEELTLFVVWAGRYPDPGSGKERDIEQVYKLSETHQIASRDLFALAARVMGHVETLTG